MSCTRQHVVVTGASSGIGRSTALRLASAGWHVYAGVRRAADGEALQAASSGGQLSPLLMDVTVAEQIDAAVGMVGEHAGAAGLDGLVDNAGIGVASPVEMVPLDALRQQLEVNVVGQIAVTQALLPLLRRAAGRIVVIASIGDRFTPPFGGPLAASKAAIATLADALRQEVAPWGIKVVMIEPASINSGAADKLERDAKKAIDEFGADGARLYRDAYLGMVKAALSRERRGSPPTVVADLVLKVLTTARPHARNVVGKDARMLATVSRWLPTPALDALRRKVFGLPKPGSLAISRSA
ncbi:SDR family oxidoreductase [Mycobacterium marinum]|uniref:SDR family oxidoreductase n=1 Tax=Mycobacterium marinum TaxID=1781 RepID=UPI000B969493|nr:SDR family oxidoreductase [Mycobacterium marinum]